MITTTKLDTFNGGRVIDMSDDYILTGNRNTQDTNYHLYKINKSDVKHALTGIFPESKYHIEKEFLFDTGDIVDSYDELEEYGLITYEEFSNINNVDYYIEYAWKTFDR